MSKQKSFSSLLSPLSNGLLCPTDMWQDAYRSVATDLIEILHGIYQTLLKYEPKREDYLCLYQSLSRKYENMVERAHARKYLEELISENMGCDMDDLREWRASCIMEFMQQGFLDPQCESLTSSSVRKVKNEAMEMGIYDALVHDDMDLKRYAVLRRMIDMGERGYTFGREREVAMYIYRHRHELTNEMIASYFRMKIHVEMYQKHMYPTTDDIDLASITVFDAQAVLHYVAQLNGRDDEQNNLRITFWTKLMQRHGDLMHTHYGSSKCCFTAGRAEVDKAFSRKFVCCVIGYLSNKGLEYTDTAVQMTDLLDGITDPSNARVKDMQHGLKDYPLEVEKTVMAVFTEVYEG